MRRRLLGIIALLLLVGGGIGLALAGGSKSQTGLFFGACARSGAVLGALWLAFPRIVDLTERVPAWLLGAFLVGGIAISVRPRNVVFIAPLLLILVVMHFLGWLFRPLSKGAKERRKGGGSKGRRAEG